MKQLLLLLSVFCITTLLHAQTTEVIICKGSSSYAYHSYVCQGLKQCKASTEKLTITEATRLGRTACKYCYKSGGQSIDTGSAKPPGSPSQCTAITRRGTRCSRNVKSGNYCWQHGG